jgi:hypothetical protein
MIDKQKQFHDAIEEAHKQESELRRLLADPSFIRRLDVYLGTPKVAPLVLLCLMVVLVPGGLVLMDCFHDKLPQPLDNLVSIIWGITLFVVLFLYDSYVSLAVWLCLVGIFNLVVYPTQPLLCLTGILALMLGILAIWRGMTWSDKRRAQQRGSETDRL